MYSIDDTARFARQRGTMVRDQLTARDITDPVVLRVMGELPREEFLSAQYLEMAYADQPLPIGLGQTISQPYIVALMTQLLHLRPEDSVLEIGTGIGYQTAILARIAAGVRTIERLGQLSESAQAILGRLNIDNVEYFIGDGSLGWPGGAEFDKIIVTAAAPDVPDALLAQLKGHGTLVIPVGAGFSQDLLVVRKSAKGITQESVCGCRFVPLLGEQGFKEPDELA
jgi:protein-L-isoaspartate(D-aspartate) O-methyltransferase